jgi:hypothetical protein
MIAIVDIYHLFAQTRLDFRWNSCERNIILRPTNEWALHDVAP